MAIILPAAAIPMEAEADVINMKETGILKIETGKQLSKLLLAWFDESRRVLPWRNDPTPYRVWISEIMLQQTRVEAVKPYFERFIAALPDVRALAECPEDQLLKLWEGLGYYNRARNLKKAARNVLESGRKTLPETYEELLNLPGIGSYTAGAVASIAYGQAEAAVDGNVLRVLSRVFLYEKDVLSQKAKREMEDFVRAVIPEERSGDFNQALMELGAVVCVPNGSPDCGNCPLKGLCLAHREDRTSQFPVKVKKAKRRIEERTVFLLQADKKVALHKREEAGLLAGLYEFPNTEGHLDKEKALEWVKARGLEPVYIEPLEDAKHIFSHVEWRMKAYAVLLSGWREPAEYLFIEPEETKTKYPIPAAFLAYTRYMNMELGYEKARREFEEE